MFYGHGPDINYETAQVAFPLICGIMRYFYEVVGREVLVAIAPFPD